MKKLRGLLLFGLAVAIVAGWYFYGQYDRFCNSPLRIGAAEPALEIARGSSFTRIVAEIQGRGLSGADPLYWRALGWQMRVLDHMHAGEYELKPGMTPADLLRKFASGDVIQHRFTIVEGWTLRELRAALAKEPLLRHELLAQSDAELMTALGAPGVFAEGRFLPETYSYVKGDSDLSVLKRAYQAMGKALDQVWNARASGLPLESAADALILASIVERETGRADERPRIAGVFARRLKLGMKLQTDPTVIYGLGASFNGNLTRRHLDTDTPYNTYTRTGLPPTPIALPGLAALQAATQPASGKELYFVARGDGSHQFSATLAEHSAAVAKFQLHR